MRTDSVEFWDFEQQGAVNPGSTGAGFEVRRGDAWAVDCYYGPTPDGAARVWGLGSDDEMCIDFLYYYPRQVPRTRLRRLARSRFRRRCQLPLAAGVSRQAPPRVSVTCYRAAAAEWAGGGGGRGSHSRTARCACRAARAATPTSARLAPPPTPSPPPPARASRRHGAPGTP